ncbi:MAG: EAL and HDOD domain-containing protein, partial [Comamonas sp.]
MSVQSSTLSTPTSPAAASKGQSMIARQAIVNVDKEVIGYELFNRSRAPAEHTAATDVLLLFTALSHAGSEDLVGTRLLFVNSTHESLAGGHLELLNPEKVVLEVEPLGHVAVARLPMLRSLRERGFKLSFNHTVLESAYATWLPLADYIKLDLTVLRPEQLAVLVSYAARHSKAQLIATKVETQEQFDLLKSIGVSLFQGY